MKYSIDELREIMNSIPFTKLCHRNIRCKGRTYTQVHDDSIITVVSYESLSGLYRGSSICISLYVNGTFGSARDSYNAQNKLHTKCYNTIKKRIAGYLTLLGLKEIW
jgi:hypothetical protein